MNERVKGTVRAPELPAGMEWLNVERPLTIAGLRGKVVLIDFWTFCCINCMHVLPQLKKLEARFPNEVVVIGVHSAKFPAEGETFNLRQAVMRLDVRHPVVNDRHFVLWRAYATRAWPTLVIIDPEGRVVGAHSGEFDGDTLGDMLEGIIRDFDARGGIDRTPLHLQLEKQKQPETLLSFPGKVLAVPPERFPRELEGPLGILRHQGALFVADTDHHRIRVFGLDDGRLRATFGEGAPGFVDGPARQARLNAPQGMAIHRGALYAADTDNHAIRRIALDTGVVTTVGGNGRQAQPWPSPGLSRDTSLNSPWDLLLEGGVLYIAMAGSHQIWTMNLQSGQLELYAGDGREALLDGPRRECRLAQPSGLTSDGSHLWFADSETSSLRSVPLAADPSVPVKTCLGHGLFEFGDVDGDRQSARLQHPLGVAAAAGKIYLADSYNNRIKVYDPETRRVRAFAGSGEPGIYDGPADEASFWEPGGISACGDRLYVADTNNHAIRRVELGTGEVTTLDLIE